MRIAENSNMVVGCAVSDRWAQQCSARVVEHEGGQSVILDPLTLEADSRRYGALIYDLAPWDDEAVIRVNRVRRRQPDLPILFFIPPVTPAVSLIPECGRLPNVRLRMQQRAGDGLEGLQDDVRWLFGSAPVREVLQRITEALGGLPAPLTLLTHYVLRSLTVHRRPTVLGAAASMRISKRTLERHFRQTGFPPPKEVVDWVALLQLTLVADRGGLSLSGAARRLRCHPNDVYRLRKRLLSRAAAPKQEAGLFPSTLSAFVTRCQTLQAGCFQEELLVTS